MWADVGWFRPATLGGFDGFSIYEAKTRPAYYRDYASLATLCGHFPELCGAFRTALSRGRLPSRMRSLWRQLFHGCPAPDHYSLNNQ